MRTYTLRPNAHYGVHTGVFGQDFQVLAGYHGDRQFVLVYFDMEGNLKDVTVKDVSELGGNSEEDFLEKLAGEVIFTGGPISIKSFMLDEFRIGIEDLPEDSQYFLEHEDEYPEEEKEDYQQKITDWIETKRFVFWWENDFWCNVDGFIVAS